MARECKRKRDERRFGKPERLADLLITTPPEQWKRIPPDVEVSGILRNLQSELLTFPVIDCTNVMDYYGKHEKLEWDYAEDTPCASPPFLDFWVEMRCPDVMVTDQGLSPRKPGQAEMMGFFVSAWENDGSPVRWGSSPGDIKWDIKLEDVRWILRAQPVFCVYRKPLWASFYKSIPVASDGRIAGIPLDVNSGFDSLGLDGDSLRELCRELSQGFMPLLLAISFMNCKNVTVEAHEPDKVLNRERKKHGQKPFVRYHTINIEPMKRVLRTEGHVETEGLKKALHICRGHFATYTPERPLFGRVAGTFWIPAHVRGSLKEGVVVSDYNVHAPQQEAQS